MSHDYASLLADLKQHLILEYQSGDWLSTDADTHRYFRELALKQKKAPPAPLPALAVKPVVSPAPPYKPIEMKAEIPKEEIKPEAKPVKEEKSPPAKSAFQPAPMPPAQATDLSDLRKIIQEHDPAFAILDHIPSHGPEIAVAFTDEPHAFYDHLVRAIDLLIAPAALVKAKDLASLSKLKLVISPHALETPNLFAIEEPAFYMQNPSEKSLLWSRLKSEFLKGR